MMKHIAQECLNKIANDDYELSLHDSFNGTNEDMLTQMDNDLDTLQELIDCQFTLDDLIILSLGLKVLMTVDKHFGNDNKNVQRVKEKIKKQKEMWVSDDV